MGWATLWAIFSRTHLVTLMPMQGQAATTKAFLEAKVAVVTVATHLDLEHKMMVRFKSG
jgi:hypothetical protein